MTDPDYLKPVIWIGSSRRDLSAIPEAVQGDFGYALYVAQQGGTHRKSKPLKGFGGAGVVEIVSDYRSDTYRCIYTVRIAGSVYVLHVFQKKSKKRLETPKVEIERVKQRLREAERIAKGQQS
jgi:phage-related protein